MSELREQTNVRPDRALLPEDSVLYQKPKERSERQKLSQMSRGRKLEYIAMYYGRGVLLTAAAAGVMIFLLCHFLFHKEIALAVLAVNTTTKETTAADEAACYEAVLRACGIDAESVTVSIDSSIGVSPDPNDSVNKTNVQAVQNRFLASAVDVLFADEEFLFSLAELDYLADLRDILPDEALARYEKELVYATSLETGETYPVGIRLRDNAWIEASGWYDGAEAVIGVAADARHAGTAEALVLEVLGEL